MLTPVLFPSGSVGTGRSTLAAEINDALAELRIPNAALDLDALVWQWPATSEWNTDLMFENLAAIWPNFARRGVNHLVLARVVESEADLDRFRVAIPDASITICRLTAPERTRLRRVTTRMPAGPSRAWHLRRSVELEAILERSAIEDFT